MKARETSAIRRIVITRASGQNDLLRAELTNAFRGNVDIIELPCVEFREPEDTAALDGAIRSLGSFAWILFASQNAVRYFSRRMGVLGVSLRKGLMHEPRIGAIGAATAEAAARDGLSVDFVSRSGTGRNFARSFQRAVGALEGVKILVPRSDVALRDSGVGDWTAFLAEAGAEVTSVTAYETCAPEGLKAQLAGIVRAGADCFVFFSPSAFRNFTDAVGAEHLERLAAESVVAAIGPTTAVAIRGAGVDCVIESGKPAAKLLAETIASYLKSLKHRSVARHAPREGANWA